MSRPGPAQGGGDHQRHHPFQLLVQRPSWQIAQGRQQVATVGLGGLAQQPAKSNSYSGPGRMKDSQSNLQSGGERMKKSIHRLTP